MKRNLIFSLLTLLIVFASFQQQPVKPTVRLEQQEVQAIVAQLDTLTVVVIRSDMAKPERNNSQDRLNAIRNFLITKFSEQNKPDSTKAVKK